MLNNHKTGLVLSGGGAKGAYQAGVIKALSEFDIHLSTISGASIGALNGAIICNSNSLAHASEQMYDLWQSLAEDTPMEANRLAIAKYIGLRALSLFPTNSFTSTVSSVLNHLASDEEGLLSEAPLERLINQYFPSTGLPSSPELYVSLYKSSGGLSDFAKVITAMANVEDTADSEFFHVQSLTPKEQKQALLASAAVPLAFAPKEIAGEKYSDGGQGGWNKLQGNTPIQPLIEAGCDLAIVTHLEDGSLWNRHDFPEITVLEIRPQRLISKNDIALMDMFDFSESNINAWIQQGYDDTQHCVGRVLKALKARQNLKEAINDCQASLANNGASDRALNDAMARIRN